MFEPSGCSAVWLAHLLWEQRVAGSNPVTPTRKKRVPFGPFSFGLWQGSNPRAGALRKQSCGLFLATGVAAATRSGFAKQKHVEPGQSTARSMGKLFSDANQSCASFSSRPTHWRPPVRNIVASLAWSASRCSAPCFFLFDVPACSAAGSAGTRTPKKAKILRFFGLGTVEKPTILC